MTSKKIEECMENQPTINIGVTGHVANGKSTMVEKMTGIKTQKHSDEHIRNITIKLGYANCKIFKCHICDAPECYKAVSSSIRELLCAHCNTQMKLVRHISFVDTPGHNLLMATMLNGTCVMNYTILMESLQNKVIPAPQTLEHITATTITGTPNVLICMNKVDLVKKPEAYSRIMAFKESLQNTIMKDSPIVPISATFGTNVDILTEYLANIEIPKHDLDKPCKMIVIRSFNVNRPGMNIKDMVGGVVGGSIMEGCINVGDTVFLKPGYVTQNTGLPQSSKDTDMKRWTFKALKTKVLSIKSEDNKLTTAIPGGLIALQLDIDPALASDDKLIGNVVVTETDIGKYNVFEDIFIKYTPFNSSELNIKKGDEVTINVNARDSTCSVVVVKGNNIGLQLITRPICVKVGEKVTLSSVSKQSSGITILGSGIITKGNESLELS